MERCVPDETGVRVEETATTTMEKRGAKHVPIRTSGKERQMFTVWLSSTTEWTGDTWVCFGEREKCHPNRS